MFQIFFSTHVAKLAVHRSKDWSHACSFYPLKRELLSGTSISQMISDVLILRHEEISEIQESLVLFKKCQEARNDFRRLENISRFIEIY
jgi:hypothetical protein